MGVRSKIKEWWAEKKKFKEEHEPFVKETKVPALAAAGSQLVGGAVVGSGAMIAMEAEPLLSPSQAKKLVTEITGKEPQLVKWEKPNAGWAPIKQSGKKVRHSKGGTVFYRDDFLRPSIVAHEAGHAKAYSGFLGKTKHFGSVLLGKSHIIAPALAFMLAKKEIETGKKDEKLRKALTVGSGVAAAGRLIPEAEATIRGLKHFKFKKGKLPLALALGSYAVPAAATALAPHFIMRAAEKEIERKKAMKSPGKVKKAADMPPFLEQDRPKKVKKIYAALKREHPEMPAEMKARIAARQGKKGKQKQGPPYKAPITKTASDMSRWMKVAHYYNMNKEAVSVYKARKVKKLGTKLHQAYLAGKGTVEHIEEEPKKRIGKVKPPNTQ